MKIVCRSDGDTVTDIF